MARSLFSKARHARRDPDLGMQLTRRDTDDIYESMRDTHRMLARDASPSHEGAMSRTIAAGEVFGASVLVGVLAARLGTANIPGTSIPLAPVAGLIGHAAALFHREIGIPEKAVDHLHNVSNGLIGGWGTLWGMGLGAGMREKAGLAPTDVRVGGLPGMPSQTIGYGPGCNGGAPPMMNAPTNISRPLGEAELAAMYRRAA